MNARVKPKRPEVTPGTDVGGYLVRGKLGAGAFGQVFLAERGGALYALKLVPLENLGPWGERELLTLVRVKQANAARLLGHCYWPDKAARFLVVIMEYVQGRRLDAWARLENPSARQVVRLVLGVARALGAVHRAKALHRDVKEANIVVREPTGEAVLVDFGVGSYEDTSRITLGALPPGTRDYLSPEAWRFHRQHADKQHAHYVSTPADDVYALGVTLYWLLTDRRPFTVEGPEQVNAVLAVVPEPPHVRNPRVPVELGALCMALLSKSPEERPATEALCVELEELLTREGVAWDAPLCELFTPHNVTTRPGADVDDEQLWCNEVRDDGAPPRRGRRPAQVAEYLPPVAVPSRAALWLLLALAVSVGGWAVARSWPRAPPAVPAVSTSGQEVAPLSRPPEAEEAAAPPQAPPTPAAIASRAMPPKEPASVKTPKHAGVSKPSTGLGAVGKTVGVALAACALATGCPGPQVRPTSTPPPEPCPPGALEAMEKLGIRVGREGVGSFFFVAKNSQPTTVTEGLVDVRYMGDFRDLPQPTTLSGRLIFGERVYGRLTRARSRDGKINVPVCLEMIEDGDRRGLSYMGERGPGTAQVWSFFHFRAVNEFK